MRTGTDQVTVETVKRLLDALNAHGVDVVMSFFVDDCVLEMPCGPNPWGRRLEGRERVREELASRFAGIPTSTTATRVTGLPVIAAAPNGS